MKKLMWDESFATGDETIDGEHQEIFRYFNLVCDKSDLGFSAEVAKIEFYRRLTEHFIHEERFIQQKGRQFFFETIQHYSNLTDPKFLDVLRRYLKVHLDDHGLVNISLSDVELDP